MIKLSKEIVGIAFLILMFPFAFLSPVAIVLFSSGGMVYGITYGELIFAAMFIMVMKWWVK